MDVRFECFRLPTFRSLTAALSWLEAGLQSYDIQAPIAVIEAAGGIVTNWEGEPVHNGGRALAAATPELHAVAMELLEGA